MARDRGMRDQQCDSIAGLMERLGVRSGGALLARLGCAGNTEALWETLAREIALALMPDDEIAALVVDWQPFPDALREFGKRALLSGADPVTPTLSAELKLRLIGRLTRPAQVAFETYALAREVASHVVLRLRPPKA